MQADPQPPQARHKTSEEDDEEVVYLRTTSPHHWGGTIAKPITKPTWKKMRQFDMPPPRSQEDALWPAPALTRTQKSKARTMLQEQAEHLGGLSQDTAEKLAQWRTLQRLVRGETVTAADIAWSWVAERIQKGDPMAVGISRPSAGPERKTNRYWKESSQTRSGWKAHDRHKFSPQQLEALVETATLEDILVTLDLQDRPGEAPYLSGQQRRDMWQKVKTRAFFKGPGGMRKFNISLGLLMVRGDLQGPVADPKEGGWWEEVMQVSSAIGWTAAPTWGIQTKGQGNPSKQEKSTDPHQGRTRDKGLYQDPTQTQHLAQTTEMLKKELEKEHLMQMIEDDTGEPWYPRQGRLPNSMWDAMEDRVDTTDPTHLSTSMVVVDLMAASQSLRAAAEEVNLIYIPLDKRQFVFSPAASTVVENIPFDILYDSPQEIEDKVREAVELILGNSPWQIVYVWASPDCSTFSRMNYINAAKGNGYRDQYSNPIPDTDKGLRAAAHDEMVENIILLIKYWAKHWKFLHLSLENPVGGLAMRPYMNPGTGGWIHDKVLRREIHYCAYGHRYKKPTHIWTNLFAWDPSGETQTGTCTKTTRCGQGAINPETGKYKHHKSLGQASKQEVSGPGRAAYKASVPRNLHRELLRVLLRTLYDKGWGKGKNTRHTQ